MKIKPVTLCVHGSYNASFEACFVDLECHAKHNLLTALLENSRNHHGIACFSVNSLMASPLGLSSHSCVEWFQSRKICNHKTD